MLLQGIGVGPAGEEGGVSGLGGYKSSIKVGASDGSEEEGVRQGKDVVIIGGAGVVVRAAR